MSAPKRRRLNGRLLRPVGALLAIAALLAPFLLYSPSGEQLQIGGKTVSLEVADTDAERTKGLGGRTMLGTDHGMLFVFDAPAKACFWMKDTLIPLDMIWLSESKGVVHLQQNVSPDTYPKSFCPSSNAKYVIELNAGQSAQRGIKLGQTLNF